MEAGSELRMQLNQANRLIFNLLDGVYLIKGLSFLTDDNLRGPDFPIS